jgi:hypothetical protein
MMKKKWRLIIQLIESTYIEKHNILLTSMNELCNNKKFNIQNSVHRLLAMKLILKCGDISFVSRTFDLADRWCDALCEEYFRQGDTEKMLGVSFSSPLNDRTKYEKEKVQVDAYTFTYLPLFISNANRAPRLAVNKQQVESNLETWKKKRNIKRVQHKVKGTFK